MELTPCSVIVDSDPLIIMWLYLLIYSWVGTRKEAFYCTFGRISGYGVDEKQQKY